MVKHYYNSTSSLSIDFDNNAIGISVIGDSAKGEENFSELYIYDTMTLKIIKKQLHIYLYNARRADLDVELCLECSQEFVDKCHKSNLYEIFLDDSDNSDESGY
jgi:hypothetical protein